MYIYIYIYIDICLFFSPNSAAATLLRLPGESSPALGQSCVKILRLLLIIMLTTTITIIIITTTIIIISSLQDGFGNYSHVFVVLAVLMIVVLCLCVCVMFLMLMCFIDCVLLVLCLLHGVGAWPCERIACWQSVHQAN